MRARQPWPGAMPSAAKHPACLSAAKMLNAAIMPSVCTSRARGIKVALRAAALGRASGTAPRSARIGGRMLDCRAAPDGVEGVVEKSCAALRCIDHVGGQGEFRGVGDSYQPAVRE